MRMNGNTHVKLENFENCPTRSTSSYTTVYLLRVEQRFTFLPFFVFFGIRRLLFSKLKHDLYYTPKYIYRVCVGYVRRPKKSGKNHVKLPALGSDFFLQCLLLAVVVLDLHGIEQQCCLKGTFRRLWHRTVRRMMQHSSNAAAVVDTDPMYFDVDTIFSVKARTYLTACIIQSVLYIPNTYRY